MKLNLKTTGVITLGRDDHFKIIAQYLQENFNVKLTKLQIDDNSYNCIVERDIDEGAREFGITPSIKPGNRTNTTNEGKRPFQGVYEAVRTVISEQKKRKKDFISWEDLHEELLNMSDGKGGWLFVRGDEKLDLGRLKQYLAPSQLARYASMKGIKRDKDNSGIKF